MIGLQEVLRQLRAEYLEMPGLRLNAAQVQRLCGMERMNLPDGPRRAHRREVPSGKSGRVLRTLNGRRDSSSACREGTTRHRNAFREGVVTAGDPARTRWP